MPTTGHDLETGWRHDTPVGDTLLRRFVCNLATSWEAAATAMQRRTLRRDAFVAADFARPTGLFNSVTLTRPLHGDDLHAALDEIEAFYSAGAGDVQLWSPWPTPDLTGRGWLLEGHPPLLLRPPSGPVDVDAPAGLRIERVTDADGVDDWCRVAVEGFPLVEVQPYHTGDLLDDRILRDDRWRLFVGYAGDEPVCIGTLFVEHGLGNFFLAVTRPEVRGRGYYGAISRRRIAEAPVLPLAALFSDDSRPAAETASASCPSPGSRCGGCQDHDDRPTHTAAPRDGCLRRPPRGCDRDQFDLPTPCADWTVRDLIDHVVDEQVWAPPLLAGESAEEIGNRFAGDRLGDLFAAWRVTVDATRAATSDEGVLTAEVRLPSGTTSGAEFLQELFADHLIHTWDLARATGGDERLPDHLVAACSEWFDAHEETWRAEGEIGPPVDVPDDADVQTRLLARFGRDAAMPRR